MGSSAGTSFAVFPVLDGSQDERTLLSHAVAQFNSQAGAPHFKVTTWKLGFHIIPTIVHDQTGSVRTAANPLDAIISVPLGQRSARDQFRQLGAALSKASDVPIHLIDDSVRPGEFDQLFSTEPSPFVWGGHDMVGRHALAELILRSATSFSWQLRCQPSVKARDRFCFLNIGKVEVESNDSAGKKTTKPLTYDQCAPCPPRRGVVPPPPPPEK